LESRHQHQHAKMKFNDIFFLLLFRGDVQLNEDRGK